MTDGGVMMLIEVSAGWGRAKGEGTVEKVVDETVILGREGVMGWTGIPRAWYQANTGIQHKYVLRCTR